MTLGSFPIAYCPVSMHRMLWILNSLLNTFQTGSGTAPCEGQPDPWPGAKYSKTTQNSAGIVGVMSVVISGVTSRLQP